jgi:hypothetical protein
MNDLKNHSIDGMIQKVQEKFKCSIPFHFDMLNATPYSLSKEGNLIVERMNGFNSSRNVQRFNAQKIM